MNLIAAVDENWGIGKDGKLLFSIKQDMRFFRDTTIGHVVVMGRKTLDSFPGGRALKDRVNIALTRDGKFTRENVTVCNSTNAVLDELKKLGRDDVFIIGGAEIYKQFLPYCEKAYITKVAAKKDADAFIENLDRSDEWQLARCTKDFSDGGPMYRFCVYERK
ncbi:MAG: dihydrofolate reductase [Firmicutes bacterium]|nr:dihydrofolate reductase [Bacillota bacterium]